MGILADADMRAMKRAAHELFDSRWSTPAERARRYSWLALKLDIDASDCHFGYFDKPMLAKAINVMLEEIRCDNSKKSKR